MLVEKAWPLFVDESRQQLGGELHYQAVAYHCLRQAGVPARQLGMNVKQWIEQPVTELFKLKSISKKHPAYNGGFEPIPDIVLFKPEVNGNWQRRNTAVTLANMLMVIEMKASTRTMCSSASTDATAPTFGNTPVPARSAPPRAAC